jgi:anaphase-promoting complex subunit 2
LLSLVILHWYFKRRLEELSTMLDVEFTDDVSPNKDGMDLDEKGKVCNKDGEMDVDECYSDRRFSENSRLVKNIGKVVLDLRSLGFTSMAEDAYASAIFLLLKVSMFM